MRNTQHRPGPGNVFGNSIVVEVGKVQLGIIGIRNPLFRPEQINHSNAIPHQSPTHFPRYRSRINSVSRNFIWSGTIILHFIIHPVLLIGGIRIPGGIGLASQHRCRFRQEGWDVCSGGHRLHFHVDTSYTIGVSHLGSDDRGLSRHWLLGRVINLPNRGRNRNRIHRILRSRRWDRWRFQIRTGTNQFKIQAKVTASRAIVKAMNREGIFAFMKIGCCPDKLFPNPVILVSIRIRSIRNCQISIRQIGTPKNFGSIKKDHHAVIEKITQE